MPSIVFLAAHRKDRSPSQRFRFEQYFDYLEQQGFECKLLSLINEEEDKVFYKNGNYFKKFLIVLNCYFRRKKHIREARKADLVFIQREAFMTGSVWVERKLKQYRKKIIFDFDDSIWLSNVSNANRKFNWLKNPGKTSTIIALSDLVIVGNSYLAQYAKGFNKNVIVIPTTIDISIYNRLNEGNKNQICIGWSGSITTIQHFNFAVPILKKIKEKYGDRVCFKVMGDPNYINNELDIIGIPWSSESEIKTLSTFDIGIMPLPDDEWAKGKCGLKGLQYMALEIPTIMSPVGVNTEIITDSENGFLASSIDEWMEKLSQLIESESLRKEIGKKARQTVVNRYSVDSQKSVYHDAFLKLLNG